MAHSGMKTSVASGHLRMFRRFIQLNGVTKGNSEVSEWGPR